MSKAGISLFRRDSSGQRTPGRAYGIRVALVMLGVSLGPMAGAQDADMMQALALDEAMLARENFVRVLSDNSELRPTSKRSSAYLAKLGSHIKRFIVYVARNGEERALNPLARFQVRVSPNGEISAVRLLQSSGIRNWDLTAARAWTRVSAVFSRSSYRQPD